jgi:hypothetical protein
MKPGKVEPYGNITMNKDFNYRWLIGIMFGSLFTFTIWAAVLLNIIDRYLVSREIVFKYQYISIVSCFATWLLLAFIIQKISAKIDINKLLVFCSIVLLISYPIFLFKFLGVVRTSFFILLLIDFIFLALGHEWARKLLVALICVVLYYFSFRIINITLFVNDSIYFNVIYQMLILILPCMGFMSALYFALAYPRSSGQHLT